MTMKVGRPTTGVAGGGGTVDTVARDGVAQNASDITDLENTTYTKTETDDKLDLKQDILSEGAFVDGDKTKLNGIENNAEANIQSDYNETDNTKDDYIKNKPDLSIYQTNANMVDEDDMVSDSDTKYPTQQSVKKYIDDGLGNKVDKVSGKSLSTHDYTDDDKNKLAGIEANATADQTATEIKTAYESNADTNAFTDIEKTNLSNQSGINTGDQDLSGKENISNKVTSFQSTPDDTHYASEKLVKDNLDLLDSSKEPVFTKNTAFNKDFGSIAGTVTEGNDSRLSDSRPPISHTHTASEITDFDTEVDNNPSVTLNTAKRTYPEEDEIKLSGLNIEDIVAGSNIIIDKTDPKNPIINSSGGGLEKTIAQKFIYNYKSL